MDGLYSTDRWKNQAKATMSSRVIDIALEEVYIHSSTVVLRVWV